MPTLFLYSFPISLIIPFLHPWDGPLIDLLSTSLTLSFNIIINISLVSIPPLSHYSSTIILLPQNKLVISFDHMNAPTLNHKGASINTKFLSQHNIMATVPQRVL